MKPWILFSLPAHSFNKLQMKSIDISVLIRYVKNQLPREEKRDLEVFLRKNPPYQKILKGLEIMQNNLKEGEDIESYMEEKKNKLKHKIFNKKSYL